VMVILAAANGDEKRLTAYSATVRIAAGGVLSQFGPLCGLELSLNRHSPSMASFHYGESVLPAHCRHAPKLQLM